MKANVTTGLVEFKEAIDAIDEQEDRDISKAMLVLIRALAVGTILDRLVSETGYPQQFVGPIVSRMQQSRTVEQGLHR